MGNFKVKVDTLEESKEVQELLVKLGYHARKNWTQRNPIHESIQAWEDGEFTFSLNHNQVPVGFKELTLPELRDMVKPMKEYLDKQEDGTYKLIKADGDCVDRDWIEVPNGMNYAYGAGSFIQFTKQEMGYRDSVLVWQRESEAKPLVDWSNVINNAQQIFDHENAGKPSPNNQCAEIEQVRQTLNERQSQYGGFKGVADTTVALMDQFALGCMSNVQREALHMICSKLARIANGDPNHVDSWHDIAGYATLVVDDLES